MKFEVIKYYLILILVCTSTYLTGQQLPLFSQYSEYGDLINAAEIPYDYLNYNYTTAVGISYRDQWTTLPDRPKTFALRGSQIYHKDRGVSLILGGHIINDEVGIFNTTALTGRIAGLLQSKNQDIRQGFSAGLNLGVGQYTVDLSMVSAFELDPVLFEGRPMTFYPDVGIGLSYYRQMKNKDYLKLGLSIPQVFSLNNNYSNNEKKFDVEKIPHYYVTGSYYYMMSPDSYFQLSSWYRYVQNTPSNFDFILRYKFSSLMWIGAGLNNSGIIHTELGVIFNTASSNQAKVSYSFNPTFKAHSVAFGNIHELNLSYNFNTY